MNAKRILIKARELAGDFWDVCGDLTIMLGIVVGFVLFIVGLAYAVKIHDENISQIVSDFSDVSLIEAAVRGERHEYLRIERGAVHLPNCRFCTKKGGAE